MSLTPASAAGHGATMLAITQPLPLLAKFAATLLTSPDLPMPSPRQVKSLRGLLDAIDEAVMASPGYNLLTTSNREAAITSTLRAFGGDDVRFDVDRSKARLCLQRLEQLTAPLAADTADGGAL